MFAVGIRYLTKYAVATNLSRQRAEWPPHPGRVFMAMAAAHFETGSDPMERRALEWLEGRLPPALRASDAFERSTVRTYVPVNDEQGGITGRPRQDRTFPKVRPDDECVYFIWDGNPAPEIRAALGQVCNKVTRVGHSSSAVQMWVVADGEEPEPNWIPAVGADGVRLRVAAAGTLRYLEAAMNAEAIAEYDALAEAVASARGREKQHLRQQMTVRFPDGRPKWRRPRLLHWQPYVRPLRQSTDQTVLDGPFDENFIVLTKLDGPALGLESTLQLTRALRNRAMEPLGKQSPEWLSGHDATGAVSQHPHVAFFPLPYVGFPHADGHVMGLGMAIPRELPGSWGNRDDELRRVLGPLFFDIASGEEREVKIWKAGVWEWTLEREKRERPPLTLQRANWTGPSRIWASVTPVVLHHYPKRREGEVERIVKEAFVSALLPAPEFIAVRSVSVVQGAGHAMSVPVFREGGATLCPYQTHAVVRFRQLVRGPVLAGRGRFRGYGLFRPLAGEEAEQWMS